jgi:hypothetical protein
MEKRYWNNVLWSPSYFAASCGGAPLSIIKQCVEQQKTRSNGPYIPGLKVRGFTARVVINRATNTLAATVSGVAAWPEGLAIKS